MPACPCLPVAPKSTPADGGYLEYAAWVSGGGVAKRAAVAGRPSIRRAAGAPVSGGESDEDGEGDQAPFSPGVQVKWPLRAGDWAGAPWYDAEVVRTSDGEVEVVFDDGSLGCLPRQRFDVHSRAIRS